MNKIVMRLWSSLVFLGAFTILLGLIYPSLVTLILQGAFIEKAQGIVQKKQSHYCDLLGQSFSDPKYFWGRPSSTDSFPYNGLASGGSNLSTANPILQKNIKERIEILLKADPTNTQPIPIDLVTASASGLDPHISIYSAEYQISRIMQARDLSQETLLNLVNSNSEGRQFGILGEPRINVIKLNLQLDEIADGT